MEERRVCGSFLLCWGVEDNSAKRERKLLPNTEVHERRGWELTNHSPKTEGGGQSLWQCCATRCCPSKGAGQQFLASQSFKLWKSISLWSERKEQRSHTEEELTLAGRNEKFVGAHLYEVGCRNVCVCGEVDSRGDGAEAAIFMIVFWMQFVFPPFVCFSTCYFLSLAAVYLPTPLCFPFISQLSVRPSLLVCLFTAPSE